VLRQPPEPLAIDGLVNLRDLGGLRTTSGAPTRPGRLLRSESLHSLSASGMRDLLELGVGAVVDLRTASERERHPSPLVDVGVLTLHAPIFTDDDDYPVHLTTAAEVYGWWLRERSTGVAGAMSAIADAPSAPVLVHCHAGKDRTGVVVALVLRLAGVDIDVIADDYAVSGVQLADMLSRDRVRALEEGMDDVRAERLFTVRREAMMQTMVGIDAEHGGAVALLRSIGLDDTRIERLTGLLLSPTWP
jgi:protein tyrosine/serine phosphatase